MTSRTSLWAGISAGALILAGATAPAFAQETATADKAAAETATSEDVTAAGLKEIVVTAQKRETNLQKTPISISVMGVEDLANRHVQSLGDLGDGAVPSLRIAPFFVRNSALTIGMRGIGALGDANQPARDQAVGVYIDGVYLGRAQGLGSALYDVERIEVLKGPQGTLFGRNTEGGAISIVTRRPSGQFRMNTTVGYGNYNQRKVETHVDFPEFHRVSFKLDALLSQRDGTVDNPTSNGEPDFNAYDKRGVAFEGLWRATDTFTVDYAYDLSHDGTTPYFVNLLAKGALPLAPIAPARPDRIKVADIGVPLRFSNGDAYGHRLNFHWQPSSIVEVKTILSYRKLKQGQYDNAEAALSVFTPNAPFLRYSIAHVNQHQYSGEAQVLAHLKGLELVGGAFYYREQVRDDAQTPNTLMWNATGTGYTPINVNLVTYPFDRHSHVASESSGVFAQGVWTPEFAPIAHLTLGGRFTHDHKQGALDVVNGALPSFVDANRVTIVGPVPLNASWNRFDPLVNLAVDVAPDINVYGRWSTGYKAGGANSRSLTYRPFDPETVSMFEAGFKSEFWDRRVRFNAAAYTGKLKDAQVDFNVIIINNNRGTLETTNAATGTTKGFEADLTLAPVEGLTLTASYAYSDIKLSKAFNPFINASSTIYPLFSPRNAGSVAADYELPVGGAGAKLLFHADANLADGQYTSSTDPTLSDKSTIVNARVALSDIKLNDSTARLQLALWSRNLFDEAHVYFRNVNASLGTYGGYNEPRTFGVEAKLSY